MMLHVGTLKELSYNTVFAKSLLEHWNILRIKLRGSTVPCLNRRDVKYVSADGCVSYSTGLLAKYTHP